MNQTEGILSFSINLPEMKIGIGFFLLKERKRGGGSGVLINVIVNSIDNSNLPVVCNVETFWYIQVCLQPVSAKIVHIIIASASGLILADAKLHAQVHSFRLSHMTSSLLEEFSRNESDSKDTDQR